jgi:hypothetical protein
MKNLNDAGVVTEFAKMLIGLKTDAVYERYSIAPPHLLEVAVAQLSAHLQSPVEPKVVPCGGRGRTNERADRRAVRYYRRLAEGRKVELGVGSVS